MLFGDRIKAPAGLFPAEFVEMRLFGPYEPAIRPALLFRLMELTLEQRYFPDNPAYRSFLCLLSQSNQAADQALTQFDSVQGNKEASWQLVEQLACASGPLLSLYPHNPDCFPAICEAAGFSLTITSFCEAGDAAQGVQVAMGLQNGMLFLLYPHYTRDSFVDFPCGHYHLKYHFFELLQKQFTGKAVAYTDFAQAQLSCFCGCSVQKAVYDSCFLYKTPTSSIASPYCCHICHRDCKDDQKCGDHWCCLACSEKNYFTANFRLTPCCKRELNDREMRHLRKNMRKTCPHLKKIRANLQHDKALREIHQTSLNRTANPYAEEGKASKTSTSSPPKEPVYINSTQKAADPPFIAPKEGSSAPMEEGKQPFVSAKPLISPQLPPGHRLPAAIEVQNPPEKCARCQNCGALYTELDSPFQCALACQCRLCIIQALVGRQCATKCSFCDTLYPIQKEDPAARGFKRCHVCEVVVDVNDIEFSAPCKQICRNCVIITKNTVLGIATSTKGSCRVCSSNKPFKVDGDFYSAMRANKTVSACCVKGNERDSELRCGHYVCARHREALKFCRACQKPAIPR